MAAIPITISTDASMGLSWDKYAPPPPAPPTPAPMTVPELPIPMAWPPGVGLGSVRKTSTVLHRGRAIIQDGHDTGKLIPRFTVAQPNAFQPVLPLSSSRSTVMSAGTVLLEGTAAACTTVWIPLLTSGFPFDTPSTITNNLPRSVYVGATLGDFIAGIVGALVSVGLSWISQGAKGLASKLVKSLVMAAEQLAMSAVQHMIDPTYPIRFDLKIPLDDSTTVKISLSCDSSDTTSHPSSISVGVESKPTSGDDGSGVKAGASVTATWDAGANSSKEGVEAKGSVSASSPGGTASAEVKEGVHKGDDGKMHEKSQAEAKVTTPAGGASAKVSSDEKGVKKEVKVSAETPDGEVKRRADQDHPWGPPL